MRKITQCRSGRPLGILFAVLVLVLTLGTFPALAVDDALVTAEAEEDAEAKAILLKTANFIAKTPAFDVTIRSGYDAIQTDGQRIEFGEKRRMLLKRPDRLRVETIRSDGERGLVVFDGTEITIYKADDNVYSQVKKTGTVDEILVYLVRDLQLTLPMARLLLTDFPQQIEKRMTEISYVEKDTRFDVPTDHLALRSADVDMQLWVAQGDQPLPRRIILTYKNAPGDPQFRADFLGWSISPEIKDDSFTFTPPAGAEQIPLLAPVRRKGSIPLQKGGKQ